MEMIENYAVKNGYLYHCGYYGDCLSGYYQIKDISKGFYSYGQYRMDVKDQLFKTIDEAVKHLGGSRKTCILPDGSVIIPNEVNYPASKFNDVLQPWHSGVIELWPGEY
jgi:hypothetical protein